MQHLKMARKAGEWFEAGMADWDISREAPYFAVRLRFGSGIPITLTCHEFWKLQQQRGLKPACQHRLTSALPLRSCGSSLRNFGRRSVSAVVRRS